MADGTGKIKLMMAGFKNTNGTVKTVLVNTKEDFLKEAGQEGGTAATENISADLKAGHTFENVAYGTYAIKVYHDANGNNKLDKNMLGIPKEAYGFSNNARGKMGLPAYESVTFEFNSPEQVIQIDVK